MGYLAVHTGQVVKGAEQVRGWEPERTGQLRNVGPDQSGSRDPYQPPRCWTLWSSGGRRRSVDREEERGGRRGTACLFLGAIKETLLTTCLCCSPAPGKRSGRARRHFHFHTFLHPQESSICLGGGREIYTLLFGNDAQSAATEPKDVFHAFPPKDKCKFTLKREAIFSETRRRPVFLLLCLITVFTRVSR